MSDSKDKNKYQNFEKYMANIGVESCYLILKNLGNHDTVCNETIKITNRKGIH